MAMEMRKEEAHKLIDGMPANATWEDLIHEIYVRKVVESGLADSQAGRVRDVGEVRAKYESAEF